MLKLYSAEAMRRGAAFKCAHLREDKGKSHVMEIAHVPSDYLHSANAHCLVAGRHQFGTVWDKASPSHTCIERVAAQLPIASGGRLWRPCRCIPCHRVSALACIIFNY